MISRRAMKMSRENNNQINRMKNSTIHEIATVKSVRRYICDHTAFGDTYERIRQ